MNILKVYAECGLAQGSAVSGDVDVVPEPRVSLVSSALEELSCAEIDSGAFSALLSQGMFLNSLALENLPLLFSHLHVSRLMSLICPSLIGRSIFLALPTGRGGEPGWRCS